MDSAQKSTTRRLRRGTFVLISSLVIAGILLGPGLLREGFLFIQRLSNLPRK